MCVIWNESDRSEFEEDSKNEEPMLCFMAIVENEQEKNKNEVEENNPSYVTFYVPLRSHMMK